MTTYRVDRNDSKTQTPVGMNSLLYLGRSRRTAEAVYAATQPGRDPWNQPNDKYGVTLASYPSGPHGTDTILRSKFL